MSDEPSADPTTAPRQVSRRSFVGYLLAGSTVVAAAEIGLGNTPSAEAALPTVAVPADIYDLTDAQGDAALPTQGLIKVQVNKDGTASFELPRAEVGQGIETAFAMIVAEELDLPVEKVHVTLAPARPELLMNQITGGSASIFVLFTPVRVAAAIARQALLRAAAIQLGSVVDRLRSKAGEIIAPDGRTLSYGELAEKAAGVDTTAIRVTLKDTSDFTVIGTRQRRLDARDAITGRKRYAMDLDVPGALPAMICRPPTLNGTVRAIRNAAEVKAMPGVTHVVTVPTGVAVRAKTFGQCIDAIRALKVDWNAGLVASASDESVLVELKRAELPLLVPSVPLLTKVRDFDFTFYFRSGSPLEPNCAVADVRADRATIWASAKVPVVAVQEIAGKLGLPMSKVRFNVVEGGGSFGRKLFHDGALEAARVSKACGAPVRLMWHRADEPRQGRQHPIATSRIRVAHLAGNILSFEQRHTSVVTDFKHGFGDVITATAARLPFGDVALSQAIFLLTQFVPYDFGLVTQTLTESNQHFNTSAVRNIYSPDVRAASELVIDQLAKETGKDPVVFRREHLRKPRVRRVLDKVVAEGKWGRPMPAGTAQGVAIHEEYKGASACLVEIDCRPETVNRPIRDGVGGPRVTKVVYAIDPGVAVNPLGLEAQMHGGIMDGIALALTASCHLEDGHFLEASWDNYPYTRQWNVPGDVKVFVMPSDNPPGGGGEAGVAAAFSAVACAYTRAVGALPKYFPINHKDPLFWEPKPFVPPVPASPTDGLEHLI
ncbi:isoquinoline 1-oxidoreductase beta subunit [Herbihabitans rhizosphaerae]|uniref:Isoquinoline 1-oxidoreductase beta subunit n=1 Tax=Herbihabitans rhizosphaerae TaxID=1872711 RepID=A0A4Q7L1Z9_9PSEU|nr:molybdopterin cofactor-binding domain-containing protein [Herbihabitans rhizosphaerae]RZS43144.1 isoquinoline 1-oxidoreductase beta subunit [Herbihabitans rhizosphaerae]